MSHLQEQREQPVPGELISQNLRGFHETALTNVEASSSIGKPQSASVFPEEKQAAISSTSSDEKIGEISRQELVRRANVVMTTKGRVSFTPQERGTVRKVLGPDSASWSDLRLAETFLQIKNS